MKKNRLIYLVTLALTLSLTACFDDEVGEYSFNATMEQPTNSDSSKNATFLIVLFIVFPFLQLTLLAYKIMKNVRCCPLSFLKIPKKIIF